MTLTTLLDSIAVAGTIALLAVAGAAARDLEPTCTDGAPLAQAACVRAVASAAAVQPLGGLR